MHDEINAAADFIVSLPKQGSFDQDARDRLRRVLVSNMMSKFQDHWDVNNPMQGNGFRSIMTSGWRIDPLISEAARSAGVALSPRLFPSDFVVWVDPHEVAYRFGESGSIGSLYSKSSKVSVSIAPASPTKGGANVDQMHTSIAVSVN